MARRMVLLAVDEPEPFTVPTVMEKSFTTFWFMELLNVGDIRIPKFPDFGQRLETLDS
jgi:hypothetical protein